MTKNVTLRLDEAVILQARHLALDEGKSLSQWLSDLVLDAVCAEERFLRARSRAIHRMESGFDLGGTPLTRDAVHER